MSKPLIRRAAIYDFLPQNPDWFCNLGHINAKWRFLRKMRSLYCMETLTACPWCAGGEFILVSTQERSGLPTSVVICSNCALVFTNPRLDSDALGDHYVQDYREIERGEIPDIHQFMFNLQQRKAAGIAQFLAEAGHPIRSNMTLADIGCGEGGLLAELSQNQPGLHLCGFELNRSAAAYGRSQGLDIRTEYFAGGKATYDLVLVEQTLEHLPDPGLLLSAIANSQEPGGVLYVGVPGLFAYPRNYGNNLLQYLQYGHLFHYTLHTLERLVVPFGYRLARGTETIQAVFIRVTGTGTLTTPEPRANDIIKVLLASEAAFRSQGSHVLRNWRAYLRYALRWLLCAFYPFRRTRG